MGPVLQSEFPYAQAVSEDMNSVVCSYCMKMIFKGSLQHCSRCKFAHYCNATCQKRDWPDHKAECQLIAKYQSDEVLPELFRLFVRIAAKRRKGVKPAFNGRTFESLESNAKELTSDEVGVNMYNVFAATVTAFMDNRNVPPPDEMLEIYGKIRTNAFGIEGLTQEQIGVGLYVGISELDHSCDPDVYGIFDGATMVIRGLKEGITKYDKKLRISYCELFDYGHARRKVLKERYGFTCDCPVCKDTKRDAVARSLRCQYCKHGYCPLYLDGDTVVSKPECAHCGMIPLLDIEDAVALMKEMDAGAGQLTFAAGGKPDQSFTSPSEMLNLVFSGSNRDDATVKAKQLYAKGESMLSHFNISLVHLARALASTIYSTTPTSDNSSMAFRAKLHEKVLICYRHYLPDQLPAVCIQYYNVGASHLHYSNTETAKMYLEKALRLQIETFGRDHVCTLHTQQALAAANRLCGQKASLAGDRSAQNFGRK